jgi:hypothetical protein
LLSGSAGGFSGRGFASADQMIAKLIHVVARPPGNDETWQYGKRHLPTGEFAMNQLIWIVGAVVIILFILGYFGLR